MRANTQRTERETGDKRGGRGMGQGTRGIQDGHYRDFQEGKQGI